MAFFTQKRIVKDIKNYQESQLEEHGIYCRFNDENIYNLKALIIGPSDTPYENGFYLFDIVFPQDYPLNPPKVTFMTLDDKVRFNPNLYKNGKVCVSILGTWSGPGWTSCMTLNTVLLSLQSLLHSHPIQNEPGWENCTDNRSMDYNELLSYYNYSVAIIKMIKYTPVGFEEFQELMIKQLLKNLKFHIHKITKLKKYDGKKVASSIYSMHDIVNYTKILDSIMDLINIYRDKYLDEMPNTLDIDEEEAKPTEVSESEGKKKSTRKVPNQPAKNFEVGYQLLSVNDNKMYEVYLAKNNSKRWKKIEN